MKAPNIQRLARDEGLRDLLYHIKGIIEAAENVAALATKLNAAYRSDQEAYAEASTLLEVEAVEHLGYHVKQLKTPLRRLQRDAYAQVEAETERPPRPTKNQRRAR